MSRFHFPPRDRADELILLHLNEAEWQTIVQVYLANNGWSDQHHEYDSRRVGFRKPKGPVIPNINTKGWPDLKMMNPPHFLFLELKAESGTVSDEQKLIIRKLKSCGIAAHILRPSDWKTLVEIKESTNGHRNASS